MLPLMLISFKACSSSAFCSFSLRSDCGEKASLQVLVLCCTSDSDSVDYPPLHIFTASLCCCWASCSWSSSSASLAWCWVVCSRSFDCQSVNFSLKYRWKIQERHTIQHNKEKNGKCSHFKSWNQGMFGNFTGLILQKCKIIKICIFCRSTKRLTNTNNNW